MATEKQLNYFKKLIRDNGGDYIDYELNESIPHALISPVIENLKNKKVMPPDEWNNLVKQYVGGAAQEQQAPAEKYMFVEEIRSIQSLFFRDFIKKMLEKVPEYFWSVAASSTGKYHPNYALGQGGLLRHTQAAVKIALSLLEDPILHRFNRDDQDIIIGALILHDSVKHGLTKQEYTVVEHPLLPRKLMDDSMLAGASDSQVEMVKRMFDAIDSHMGPWNTDRFGKEIMPKPDNSLERFVHLCDYLASRKFLEVTF